MKLPTALHGWQVTAQEAINIQKQLANRISTQNLAKKIRYVAGLDAAFTDQGKTCLAAVVVWDIKKQEIIEQQTAKSPVHFPYIPGLLSFREMPALLNALVKLDQSPDLLMCDGQGLAHPRRLGIASHLGLWMDMPSIGCGKSRLIGDYQEPDVIRGANTSLQHKGEIIGSVLCTKNKTKPIFVSVGHKMDLKTANKIVLDCFNGYRLPEPTRLADKLVAMIKSESY